MKANNRFSPPLTRILAGLSLILVIAVIVINLPALANKTSVLFGVGYADTDYVQRETDLLGAEVEALQFAAANTPTNVTAAWVSDDYQARNVHIRYWLYPRTIWLGNDLGQAAGQNPAVILVLKKCPANCTPAETAEPLTLAGYQQVKQFVMGNEFVSVVTKTT